MNIQTSLNRLDRFQRRHPIVGFTVGVIKRYSDDDAGYQAALLTYYGYLALFPLLLILATATQLIATSRPELQARVISATASYFPVLGDQLESHVHGLHKSGIALLIGLLILFYGARGVAAAFRHGVNLLWRTPRDEQVHFPQSMGKNLVIIIVGGLGFIGAAAAASVIAPTGSGWIIRLLSLAANAFLLFWVFAFLLKYSLPRRVSWQETRTAALISAVGLLILQLLGVYLLGRTLKHLDALYSYFALSLGLLFWIYLQAQVVYYAIEIGVVQHQKLWPRSLTGHQLTAADKQLALHHTDA